MNKCKDSRYYLHLLCGLLCTFGLVCYVMDLFGMYSAQGLFLTLIFCLGFFGIPSLLHQQWLRLPLLSAVFLLLSILVLFFDGVMQKFYLATADFSLWLIPFVANGGLTHSKYEFAFFLLLLTVIGLFCFFSISVIRSPFPVLALTAAAAIVIPFLLPDSEPALFWLLPCIIGIALALSLTAKAEKEQEEIHMRPERSFLISVISVLVSLVFLFFAAGIVVSGVPEKGFQSTPVVIRLNQLSRKIMSLFIDEQKDLPSTSLYDSSVFGMRGENMTLGGSVDLSDEMVFEVTASRDLLLKGRTYDTYSSTFWGSENVSIVMRFELPDDTFFLFQNSPDPIQVYASGDAFPNPYPNSVLLSLFDTFRPAPGLIPPEYGSALFEQCDISIKNASSLIGSSLFYPDHLVDAGFSAPLFFDEDGALFAKKILPIGAEYQIRSNVFRTDDPAFEENILALEAYIIASPAASDDLTHKNSIFQNYLEANVPESVTETALSITDGYESPLEKAFAIRNYLRDNFTYSLQVPDIPDGRDFVDFFLESKIGYCTYFASAMCMMARANGIPARFVEGFYVDIPDSENAGPSTVIVTGNSAHAWCEIYIDGIGWIPFDATPGGGGNNMEMAPTVAPTNTPSPMPEVPSITPEITPSGSTDAPPETAISVPDSSETGTSVPSTKAADTDVTGKATASKTYRVLSAVLCAVAGTVIVAAAFFLWFTWRDRKYFTIPTMEELQSIGSTERQLHFLWSRCLLHLRFADIRILPLETPLDFAARLENVRVSGRGCAPGVYRFDLRENAAFYEQMIYGLKAPSQEDIESVRENCITLSSQIRTIHFSAVHYAINRMFKHLKSR